MRAAGRSACASRTFNASDGSPSPRVSFESSTSRPPGSHWGPMGRCVLFDWEVAATKSSSCHLGDRRLGTEGASSLGQVLIHRPEERPAMISHLGIRRPASTRRRVHATNPDRSAIGLRCWRMLGLAGLTCLGAAVITTASATAATLNPLTSPPAVTIGNGPVAMPLVAATHALHPANQASISVSAPKAEHCTARVNAACATDISFITSGAGAHPQGEAVDTVYVANDGGGVPLVNGATTTRSARQTSRTQACRPLTAHCPATGRHRPSPSSAHRRMSW